MLPKIAEISGLTLAELSEAESEASESVEWRKERFILRENMGLPITAQDELEYQELTRLRDCLREELSSRKQALENLSDFTIPELRELESRCQKETDHWHEEFIRMGHYCDKEWKYRCEADGIRRQVSEEIRQRMKFLKALSKWTMAELALTEARYHQECGKLLQEAKASVDSPSASEKCWKKYFVRLEARDMIRAQITKRTGQKY